MIFTTSILSVIALEAGGWCRYQLQTLVLVVSQNHLLEEENVVCRQSTIILDPSNNAYLYRKCGMQTMYYYIGPFK